MFELVFILILLYIVGIIVIDLYYKLTKYK